MIDRHRSRAVVCLMLCASLVFSPLANAQSASSLCTARGYTVLFFNGVFVTDKKARVAMEVLHGILGDAHANLPIKYDTLYNATGLDTAGATLFQDLAEVFIQRANDIDSSGELATHFELLWESAGSTGSVSYWQRIQAAIPAAVSFVNALHNQIALKLAAALSGLMSSPPTEANYASHNTRLDALRTEGQMLLFVPHSQGNLFANHAYDYIVPKIGAPSVRVVHVAPPTTTLHGGYRLSFNDLVINGLRIQGVTTIPTTNITIPLSISEPTGHFFVETYLDATRNARAEVIALMNTGLAQLQPPAVTGNVGSFTVTLTWDGAGDVDLHTFEPNRAHVYYASRQGTSGYLDVDNTAAYGPEHYYASCDPLALQAGTYNIGINDYAGANGRIGTVQVATSANGVIYSRSLPVGAVRGSAGDASPTPVVNVVVTKNASTGAISIVTQ